jgi:hypothetical protein
VRRVRKRIITRDILGVVWRAKRCWRGRWMVGDEAAVRTARRTGRGRWRSILEEIGVGSGQLRGLWSPVWVWAFYRSRCADRGDHGDVIPSWWGTPRISRNGRYKRITMCLGRRSCAKSLLNWNAVRKMISKKSTACSIFQFYRVGLQGCVLSP